MITTRYTSKTARKALLAIFLNLSAATVFATSADEFQSSNVSDLPGLTGFTSQYLDGKTYINWSISDTCGQCVYYIERSSDGVSFETLGLKKGLPGLSGQPLQYSFIDSAPLPLYSYYRIRRVDAGGETTSWISVIYNHDSLQQMSADFPVTGNISEQ